MTHFYPDQAFIPFACVHVSAATDILSYTVNDTDTFKQLQPYDFPKTISSAFVFKYPLKLQIQT